jgi:hypothetical protein
MSTRARFQSNTVHLFCRTTLSKGSALPVGWQTKITADGRLFAYRTGSLTYSDLVVYAPGRRYRQMFGDEPFKQAGLDAETGFWKLAYRNQVAKFAVDAEAGWLAARRWMHRLRRGVSALSRRTLSRWRSRGILSERLGHIHASGRPDRNGPRSQRVRSFYRDGNSEPDCRAQSWPGLQFSSKVASHNSSFVR